MTTFTVPTIGSGDDARRVKRLIAKQPPTGRAKRAAFAFDTIMRESFDLDKGIRPSTAAEVLAGLQTKAGRDIVLLVAAGIGPLEAVLDTDDARKRFIYSVFYADSPAKPHPLIGRTLDVIDHLVAVSPKTIAVHLLDMGAFLAWWANQSERANAYLELAIETDPAAKSQYKLGRVVDHGVIPPHVADRLRQQEGAKTTAPIARYVDYASSRTSTPTLMPPTSMLDSHRTIAAPQHSQRS